MTFEVNTCSSFRVIYHTCLASSSRHNFDTGRINLDSFVFISAVLTRPSRPGNTFMQRPSNERSRGMVLSTINTTSLTCKSLLFRVHFWRSCNIGKYSFNHLVQKQLAKNWARLHCLRECRSSSENIPGGTARLRR